ncbi:MAG: menaquinone biosynthesis protein [Selenomonadaceae bacterium]|nr:menaquinone biosynthesis protein [Selenomonadaceae bacterium]
MPCPRIGHINFLNVLPLGWSFQNGAAEGIDLRKGVPAEMNAAICRGELDVSNVSSILYARHSDELVILPEVCVSTDGPVTSILLVSRLPIEELNDARIVLTAQSATSHCLLKIILHDGYALQPRYDVRSITPENPSPDDAAASLFIGDNALWLYHHRQPELHYYDLGAEWKKLTGKKMVYALWVANRQFAKQHPDQLRMAWRRIRSGLRDGFTHKDEAIKSALRRKPFTYQQLDAYLGPVIKWDLTPAYLEGLQEFYRRAAASHLIDYVPKLNMAEVK